MLLSAGKDCILIKLDTEDIQDLASNDEIDLSINDSREILNSIKENYDEEIGINYELIYNYIELKAEEIAGKKF